MKPLLPLLVLASMPLCVAAQETAPSTTRHPGSSMHGEVFNEGPRQAATLIPGTGHVHFPITTKSPDAQKFFDQGIGQLHGFWYFEAERSFRQAASLDHDCALTYWGMAVANVNNPKRAGEFMKEATKRRAKASRREQLWIDAYAAYFAASKPDEKQRRSDLVRALEEITFEFPDDLEAKAFLVLQVWDNSRHGIPLSSRRMLDGLCNEVLARSGMHPGIHHYRIHVWNNQGGDKRTIDSAARCGQTAPGIAHMWHMSGHTFSSLKRYDDAAWQQEASARVDHAYMISSRVMPDEIHNFAHNNDWLVKNLLYIGRVRDGLDLAQNMVELPRVSPSNAKSYSMGRERLLELLLRSEKWDDILSLERTMYLEPYPEATAEVSRLRTLGVAAFAKGDRTRGEEKIRALEAALTKAKNERFAAAEAAETKARTDKKSEDEVARAMADAMKGFNPRMNLTNGALAELRMERALALGDTAAAKAEMEKTRDISSERQSQLWLRLGDNARAEKLAREAVTKDDQQVLPLANLTALLWELDKKDEATKTFAKLRTVAGRADLDLPPLQRLAPIAQACGFPPDWRTPATARTDVGVRPSLAALGPFRWHPTAAPAWTLPDRENRPHSLSDYKGKPVLVVFYLGSGCSGCIEQLNIFGPLSKDFAAAGISMVAVSTDGTEGLKDTFSKASDKEGFPFPILSDSTQAAFRAYRAFDDFEKMALHGTFLIDGEGLVRWQNIGFQPFREGQWLLGECKRLLSIPADRTAPAGATASLTE